MNFIKQNFLSLIILIFVFLLIIDRCSTKSTIPEQPKIERDTVWNYHTNTIISNPLLSHTIPPSIKEIKETKYLPDTNYQKLLIQYNNLLILFIEKNVQKDSLKIDSIGYVNVIDTVSHNLISGRTFKYKLKHPTITTTITLPPPKVNQLYIGGGIQGSTSSLVNQFDVGLMLKNKKDQLYGISIGVDKNLTPILGINSYWKINLRRK